jgi:hypothetical protein
MYKAFLFHKLSLYSRFINQTLDLLIKYNWILNIKKPLLLISIFYMKKISVICNQPIDYMTLLENW